MKTMDRMTRMLVSEGRIKQGKDCQFYIQQSVPNSSKSYFSYLLIRGDMNLRIQEYKSLREADMALRNANRSLWC